MARNLDEYVIGKDVQRDGNVKEKGRLPLIKLVL